MTIAIEPMATLGSYQVFTAQDDWTIETRDGSLAAHFEDTYFDHRYRVRDSYPATITAFRTCSLCSTSGIPPNMQKAPYFVGLDIGTANVRCVIGMLEHREAENHLSVIGMGSSPNHGMRKGSRSCRRSGECH